jgi:hypothetical protein
MVDQLSALFTAVPPLALFVSLFLGSATFQCSTRGGTGVAETAGNSVPMIGCTSEEGA